VFSCSVPASGLTNQAENSNVTRPGATAKARSSLRRQTRGEVGALAEVEQPVAHALLDVERGPFRRFECLDAVQRQTAPRTIQRDRLVCHSGAGL
jgi:hypothetical protein